MNLNKNVMFTRHGEIPSQDLQVEVHGWPSSPAEIRSAQRERGVGSSEVAVEGLEHSGTMLSLHVFMRFCSKVKDLLQCCVHQLLLCPIRPSEPWPWFWSLGDGKRNSLKASIPAAATSLCYHGSITTMQQQGVWVSWNWNQNSGDWSQPQGHQGGYDSYGYANAGYQNQGKGGGYGYDDSYGGSYSCSVQNLFQLPFAHIESFGTFWTFWHGILQLLGVPDYSQNKGGLACECCECFTASRITVYQDHGFLPPINLSINVVRRGACWILRMPYSSIFHVWLQDMRWTGGYNSEMKGSRGNGRSQESSGEQGAPKEIKGLVRWAPRGWMGMGDGFFGGMSCVFVYNEGLILPIERYHIETRRKRSISGRSSRRKRCRTVAAAKRAPSSSQGFRTTWPTSRCTAEKTDVGYIIWENAVGDVWTNSLNLTHFLLLHGVFPKDWRPEPSVNMISM